MESNVRNHKPHGKRFASGFDRRRFEGLQRPACIVIRRVRRDVLPIQTRMTRLFRRFLLSRSPDTGSLARPPQGRCEGERICPPAAIPGPDRVRPMEPIGPGPADGSHIRADLFLFGVSMGTRVKLGYGRSRSDLRPHGRQTATNTAVRSSIQVVLAPGP